MTCICSHIEEEHRDMRECEAVNDNMDQCRCVMYEDEDEEATDA